MRTGGESFAVGFAAIGTTLAAAARASAGDAPGADTGSLDAAVEIAAALGEPAAAALHGARGPLLALLVAGGSVAGSLRRRERTRDM